MTPRQGFRVLLVGLGTSVVPLDTAVNIAFPDITSSFGLPIEMIQWVVICYVLTYSSLMLAFGRAGDIWGHGRVFRIGLLWSALAYLLCAIAPSYGWLLVCRFLQGLGASLIVSCAPALVTGLFPEHSRTRAVALFTLMYAIGSAAGPLLGGILAQRWGWPAVFWFRAPIALTALLFLEGLPSIADRPAAREPIDIAGAVLLALGISTFLLFLNQLKGLDHRLFLALTFALFTIAAASLMGFVWWEGRTARPIVNLEFFRSGGFVAVNSASVLVYLTSFSVLLFGPYYLVRFAGATASMAGAILAVSFIGSILASPLAGWVIARMPPGVVAAFGAVLCATGLALIGTWDNSPTWCVLTALLLQGFGVGVFQVAYMEIVMRTLPRHHRGVAGSIAMLSRSLGTVTGATLLTLVFHTAEDSRLAGGATLAEGFLAGFKTTFWLAALVCALAGASMMRAIWDRR